MRSALSKVDIVVVATLSTLLVVKVVARIIGLRSEYGQIVSLEGKPVRSVDGIDLWSAVIE